MKNGLSTDYEKMAFDLQMYIRNYKPGSWQYNIGNVAIIPNISSDDFENFKKEYCNGNLKNYLSSHGNRYITPWYVQKAIQSFFDERYNKSNF